MRTFAALVEFSQSALLFDFPFQFVVFHFVVSVCTQFHHMFFFFLVALLVETPSDYF